MAPKVMFSCTFCNKSYNIKGSLANHMRQKHKVQQSARAKESLNMARVRKELSREMEVLQKVAENLDIEEQLNNDDGILVAAAREIEPASPKATGFQQVSDEFEPEEVVTEGLKKVEPPAKWMAKTWSGLGDLLDYVAAQPGSKDTNMELNASCGDCDGKEKQIETLEDRIGKVVNERLKMQSKLKDVQKESDEKGAELERNKRVIAEQKREILKLKEEIQNLKRSKDSGVVGDVIIESEVFKCDQCDFKSARKVTLKAHKEVVHVGVPLSCGKCGKKYRSAEEMNVHYENAHKVKFWECEKCDFTTRCVSEGKKHVQKHNKEKVEEKAECTKCDYQAVNEDDLRAHIVRSHPGALQSKRPCRFWKEGRCNKGENCRFSHRGTQHTGPTSAPSNPNACRNGAGCRFLARGSCHFFHSEKDRKGHQEQANQGGRQETRKCWYPTNCRRQSCSFVHDNVSDFGGQRNTRGPNVRNSKY